MVATHPRCLSSRKARPNWGTASAAFEKALFVYPNAPLGNAARCEDHFEVERGTALLSGSLRAPTDSRDLWE